MFTFLKIVDPKKAELAVKAKCNYSVIVNLNKITLVSKSFVIHFPAHLRQMLIF